MPLLKLDKLSLAYGHHALLDAVDFEIERGERVCLLGRNGAGKSSLLRVISGRQAPDDGSVWLQPELRVACLEQEAGTGFAGNVFDTVAAGLPEQGRLISAYHRAAVQLAQSAAAADLQRLADLQQQLEAAGGWQLEQQVEQVLSRLGLDGAALFGELSGGWCRRVLLARALVGTPDLLLLDEPTNHLDIEAICWLENFMLEFPGALLFISHDRSLARRLATRIIELDRGHLTVWPGSYDDYLRRKAAALEVEARQAAQFDRRLAQEEVWIRQGIRARRTRNEGRVRELLALREQRRLRRDRVGKVSMQLDYGEQSGKLVFEAEHVTVSFDGHTVIRDFSTTILRGDRVGIIGPNGAGKSTLLRTLLGTQAPDCGRLRRGTRLQVAYFDQQRAQLDPDRAVMDSVAEGSRRVTVNGRERHVAGYLRDFLFAPERLASPVSSLSGGERNRLLLARLFAQPANLLVLDEPTNDLDVETLELLEELLLDYPGTLLLVSHDRAFLDNVITSALVFEGDGAINEYVGGYSDWLEQRRKPGQLPARDKPPRPKTTAVRPESNVRPVKLSYRDQRELDGMPARIEALERQQAELQAAVNSAGFYQQDHVRVAAVVEQLAALTDELEAAYARWAELEQ